MRARVFDYYQRKAEKERSKDRDNQIGTGDRSEKVRTYNWPQNRVTDHRISENFALDFIIDGEMDKLIDALKQWDLQNKLNNLS